MRDNLSDTHQNTIVSTILSKTKKCSGFMYMNVIFTNIVYHDHFLPKNGPKSCNKGAGWCVWRVYVLNTLKYSRNTILWKIREFFSPRPSDQQRLLFLVEVRKK